MAKKANTGENDAAAVKAFMETLQHPLKNEIEQLRLLIKSADSRIQERIKWNAPSYYCPEDFLTFGPMRKGHEIMLVFHHAAIVDVKSKLLEGTYKDRRLLYIRSSDELKEKAAEITAIIQALLKQILP